ncbi:MAG: amidohydrolase [Clostridia bacterium]|nr:amidohydrolase [Clostridia bacterium]
MERIKKIDIHVHCVPEADLPRLNGSNYPTPDDLRRMYDRLGVDRAVLMPQGSAPEGTCDRMSLREARKMVESRPDVFCGWFCNLDPRQGKNGPDTDFIHYLKYYRAHGARGVGEMTANIYLDDPRAMNLFRCCEVMNMPVLLHFGSLGNDYGIVDDPGLPRLEKVLKTFPGLTVIGHSPRFWQEFGPGSRVERLMAECPNLWMEFSSLSGGKAMLADPEYTCRYFEKYPDRILYGTDLHDPRNLEMYDIYQKMSDFLDDAAGSGRISESTYRKICRDNALGILAREAGA